MIISRTPYRISFFGGGTDYPSWFVEHGGSVLATTINKYCYISCRYLPPFFEHRLRVVYSHIENCHHVQEIRHPSVRETLKFLEIERGVEIHHDGDLPARGGLGSSSAFTVGLLNALYALQGRMVSHEQLAAESIHIEQEILRETVGCQDQVLAAHGGFNHILFLRNGSFVVRPVILPPPRQEDLNDHLMLFFTGILRTASGVAKSYVDDLKKKERQMRLLHSMVDEGVAVLQDGGSLLRFGSLLHEAWEVKRSLDPRISNPAIEEMYEAARTAGAVGGKLTGAGGGGFLLLFVAPENHDRVKEALKQLIYVPIRLEFRGSHIVVHAPEEDYSAVEQSRTIAPTQPFRELPPPWHTTPSRAAVPVAGTASTEI